MLEAVLTFHKAAHWHHPMKAKSWKQWVASASLHSNNQGLRYISILQELLTDSSGFMHVFRTQIRHFPLHLSSTTTHGELATASLSVAQQIVLQCFPYLLSPYSHCLEYKSLETTPKIFGSLK